MTTPLQEAVANLLRVLDECLYTNDHCGLEVDKEDEAEVTAAIDAARTALAAPAPTAPSGHCVEGYKCVCGGDTPQVRAGCGNWRK